VPWARPGEQFPFPPVDIQKVRCKFVCRTSRGHSGAASLARFCGAL
jgi:hypothetical protein